MFIRQKDYDFRSHPNEDCFGPSLTEPNLTMSVNEILRRYTTGAPIPSGVIGDPVYNNGMLDLTAAKGYDLADYAQDRNSIRQSMADGTEKLRQQKRYANRGQQQKESEELQGDESKN